MKLTKSRWATFLILLVVFLTFSSTISLISDFLLFDHLGYKELLLTPIESQFALGLGVGIAAFAFLYLNLKTAAKTDIDWFYTIPENLAGRRIQLDKNFLKKLILIIPAVFGALYGLFARTNWYEILAFINSTPFGQTDPVFSKDISFYVFELPIYALTNSTLQSLIFISLILSGLIYLVKGDLPRLEDAKGITKRLSLLDKRPKMHIASLTFLLFGTFAVDTYLDLHRTLLSPGGVVFGPTYTDINIQIPFLWAGLFLAIGGAFFTLFYLFTRKAFSLVIIISVLYFASGPVRVITAGLVQGLVVSPNELERERPYLENNIKITREAYNLDSIDEQKLPAEQTLDAGDIEENQLTIKNVRLWDRQPLLSTFSQIQEIRTYYDFGLITNDRYEVDNELRQIMLSPRELNSESLPNPSWINRHLVFTHGHGVVAGPVNEVTDEGLPVLFLKDLPPVTEKEHLKIDEPSIYYGMQTNDYVIVNTRNQELDYPKGDDNVYTSYEGEGGIKIDSILHRLLYATEFASLKILLSGDITGESAIQYKRNIMERVQSLAPFLTYDMDPYLVVVEGRLYWIVDAYTKTNLYPYSQPEQFRERRINYIRNSVKVVVDAYDGSVDFYTADETDPLIKTAGKIFPETFKPLSEMPETLVKHIRYPEDIFSVQAQKFKEYHMKEARVFYNREDEWEIAAIGEESSSSGGALAPRHLIMKLPGEDEEEFVLILPFTPRGKDNMSAWLAARNDGENYGKIVAYAFPKDTLVFGPKQIMGRINQDEVISRQISLWDQRGSQVVRGPLLVIPIESSLIYVQPLYLQAEDGQIPELKRVIVAYENDIEMETTLERGLATIFGTAERQPEREPTEPAGVIDAQTRQLLRQAQDLYREALNAQTNGNWSEYGEKVEELGNVLNQLQR